MKLIVIGSNSAGNAYALDAGGEILLLEAGMKMADVKKAIDFRLQKVVGCVVTHSHGDHSKYAVEYAKFGVKVYCNEDVEEKKSFPYGTCNVMKDGKTYRVGKFLVCPFNNFHDVPIFGFLIQHDDMGVMLFSTDSYKIGFNITGVDHYLIEANYSDAMLKENVWKGNIDKAQSDRIMLSHMSLDYAVQYLRDCRADKSRNIVLCHLSERNSDDEQFRNTVTAAFGVPCHIAKKGLVVEFNKEII